MRTLHLFAGAGGGLLADLILGHEPVAAVEWEPIRAQMLWQRSLDGWFPDLEVYCGDIHAFDGSRWAGKVDCVHAGIPCPKWSTARRGAGDPEDLWDETCRVIYETRAGYVFLESVPGIKREHGRFRADLADLGVTLGPYIITDATSVGAPHARERYWSLGYTDKNREPVCSKHEETSGVQETAKAFPWKTDPRDIRVDDGVASRTDRLRACGDGQVPLQAAQAWKILWGMKC